MAGSALQSRDAGKGVVDLRYNGWLLQRHTKPEEQRHPIRRYQEDDGMRFGKWVRTLHKLPNQNIKISKAWINCSTQIINTIASSPAIDSLRLGEPNAVCDVVCSFRQIYVGSYRICLFQFCKRL